MSQSRFAPVVAAHCPDCGRQTLQCVELTRGGRPAVLECQCGYGEIVGPFGPDDIAWQPDDGEAA
jgi:hypothetical protein